MKPLLVLFFLLLNFYSCNDNPVKSEKPENRSPVILSLTVFPDVIGPLDSAIVVCNAMDPDGDTLVYDWISDGRLNLKGVLPYSHEEYNTYTNYQIFYPNSVNTPVDTPWVQCFARDRKGKSVAKVIHFIVKQ